MFRGMRTRSKTRALFVVAAGVIAAAVAGSQAFGFVSGHSFSSSPNQARYAHVPNTLKNRSNSRCPAGGQTVEVHLMQGTTSLASATIASDVKGRWAVTMSIPTDLLPGHYAVTASCFDPSGGPATLSYNAQTFRVIAPICPADTTSTTVQCRVPPSTTPAPPVT
jgi:hypothetical protein